MAAPVDVIVPFRGGDPDREAALRFVQAQFARFLPSWRVLVAHDPMDGRPWSKARVVEVAWPLVNAERVVIHDADVWSANVEQAATALTGRSWALPHRTVIRLGQQQTFAVLDGAGWPVNHRSNGGLERSPYTAVAGGGIVAVRADVYDRIPLDPRFEGWGGEDESWARALGILLQQAPWRPTDPHPLWHLWHAPQSPGARAGKFETAASDALRERYKRAAHRGSAPDRAEMGAIIAEAREALGRPSLPHTP